MSPGPTERLGYRPALDGLRAVAIGLVLLHHTSAFLVTSWSATVFPGGFLGVDLFLVLSGFLITTLLLERHDRESRPIATFYLRRALRLLPAVIVLLLVVAVVTILAGDDSGRLPATFLVVLTYTTNWAELAGVHISPYVTHLWSLAIEEQFYLLWPLLLFGALRAVRHRATLVWVVLAAALAFAAWRAALWESGEGWLRIYIRTDARADALLLGAALALAPWPALATRVGPAARTAAGAVALAGLLAVAELVEPSAAGLYLGGLTVVGALAAVAIAAALAPDSRFAQALGARPLVAVGRISYGLYLWHFPVFLYVSEHASGWPGPARVVVAWTVALAATIASYRLIERPALGLKARLAGNARLRGGPGAAAKPAPSERVRALARDAGVRRFATAAAGGSLVALVLDVWMLVAGHASLTRSTAPLGSFMDLQGRAILHGTLAVDPASAGFEGFVTGGSTYVYFGPVPSLLRLPVLAVTHRLDGRLTQLSMLLALVVLLAAGAVLHWRVRALLRAGAPLLRSDLAAAAVAQFALGAGAIPLYLASRAVAYHEAELWGAALAVAALAAIVGVVAEPSVRRVAWAGLFATLAINTRFSVALAPVAALAVLALGLAAQGDGEGRWWRRSARALAAFAPPASSAARMGVLVALAAAITVPLATYAAISTDKFHQPFGLPLDRQVDSRFDPGRRAALQANGGSLFGAKFVPTTALQVVRPDAVGTVRAFPFVGLPHAPPQVLGGARFDTLEQSLSAPTSMPLLVILTLVGLVALFRDRRWPLLGVLVASATGYVASLTLAYISTRYLADLLPFLLLGSLIGLQALLGTARRTSGPARAALVVGVAALALAGTVTNFGAGLVTQRLLSAESSVEDRAAFVSDQDTIDRALSRRPQGVRAADELSRRSPGAPGDLLILDRCAGLYGTGIAGSWVEIERTSRSGVHPLAVTLPRSTRGRAEPLVTLGSGRRRVTATVRVTGDRAVYGIAVGGRQALAGTPLPASPGRSQRVVLSVDPLGSGHVAALRVDGHFVGAAGAVYDRRAPVTLARDPDIRGTAARFTGAVRALPTPASLCRRLARRAGLPAR